MKGSAVVGSDTSDVRRPLPGERHVVTDYSDRVLLTIHGVMSDNSGLENVRKYCERMLPGLICESDYYGYHIPRWNFDRKKRLMAFEIVRLKIDNVLKSYITGTRRKLYVLAHSFGTLATIRSLESHFSDQIEGLILVGSIVQRAQRWDGYVGDQLAGPPLAVIRPFDNIVRFASRLGGAASGAEGFIANGAQIPIQSYKSGGHTAYDPDDRDDVVQAIKEGLGSVTIQTKEQWFHQHKLVTRAYIKLCNLLLY
jgi:hypothetical protein